MVLQPNLNHHNNTFPISTWIGFLVVKYQGNLKVARDPYSNKGEAVLARKTSGS